jgi:Flp pilus assembly protein TadB
MSAASARHFENGGSGRAVRRGRADRPDPAQAQIQARARARAERRRRQRHFARRRRDLLEDVALAFVVTLILISFTAGLGVIALLELPLAAGLLATVLVPRVRRRRATRSERARRPRSRPR